MLSSYKFVKCIIFEDNVYMQCKATMIVNTVCIMLCTSIFNFKFEDFQAQELGVEDHRSKSQWSACMGELSNNAWEKVGTEGFSLGQGVGEEQ